jgi:hypothetical protein
VELRLTDLPVYYINLDEDTDKAAQLTDWLKAKGFTQIHRIAGVKHAKPGRGCALAHNQALNELANTPTPFIVLEDDVKPWKWQDTAQIPDAADAYYLGLSHWGLVGNKGQRTIAATQPDGKNWRLWNMLAAHAILYLNPEYIHWLIRATDTMLALGTNQDKARAQTLKYWNVYGPERAIVYQAGKHATATKIDLAQTNLTPPLELL